MSKPERPRRGAPQQRSRPGGGGRPRGGNPRGGRPGPGPREVDQSRVEAVRQLVRVEQDSAYVGRMRSAGQEGDAQTDRQVTDYVAGVTRWKRWLDRLLAEVYHGRLEDLEPPLLQVFRIGAYELVIRGVARHAAINEAVEAARRAVRPEAAGVTNAVLRAVAELDIDSMKPVSDDPADRLAVRWSHPTWLVRRWLERYGEEDTVRMLKRDNMAPIHGRSSGRGSRVGA